MFIFGFREPQQQKRFRAKTAIESSVFLRDSATKWQNVSGRAVIFITQRTLCYSVFRDSHKLNALIHCIAQQVKSVAIVK
jgi:hypothetical protein